MEFARQFTVLGAQRPPESIVNFAVNCIVANLSVNFAENSIEGGAYSIAR